MFFNLPTTCKCRCVRLIKLDLLSLFIFFINCNLNLGGLSAQTYTIQSSPSPLEGGTISFPGYSDLDESIYPPTTITDWNGTTFNLWFSSSPYVSANSYIYLYATPSEGHFFSGWSGDYTNSLNPLSFYPPSNISLVANFSRLNLPISTIPDTNTQFYLESMSSFTASSENISNISGIQYAKNLKKLTIQQNSLTDLTPIWGLSKLTELDLSEGFSIISFDGIENLSELKNIFVEGHKISSITAFTSLPKLYHLKLQKNFLNLASTSIQSEISKLRNQGVYVEIEHQVPLIAQNLSSEIDSIKDSLLLDQSDPLANFLYAIELILNLFENTEAGSLKSVAQSLGFSQSINNFILSDLWNTNFNFEKSINNQFQYAEIENYFKNEFLPTIQIANLHLSKLTSYNTPIVLTQDKTGLENPLYVDYGDILLIKAINNSLSALIKIFISYDFSIDTIKANQLHEAELVNLEALFDSSNTFGKLKTNNHLAEAKKDLKEAISLYQAASPILISRMSYKYLFNLKIDDLDDEEKFRSDIKKLNIALDFQFDLNDSKNDSNDIINLSRFFSSKLDFSTGIPPLVGNKFVSSQISDPTLGGLMPNWSKKILENEMEEANLLSTDVLDGINDIKDAENWKKSNWLGNFFIPNRTDNSKFWMYHQQLGWCYFSSSTPSDIWIYVMSQANDNLGHWLWTKKPIYPYFFRNIDQTWLYLMPQQSSFKKWESGKWISEEMQN